MLSTPNAERILNEVLRLKAMVEELDELPDGTIRIYQRPKQAPLTLLDMLDEIVFVLKFYIDTRKEIEGDEPQPPLAKRVQ